MGPRRIRRATLAVAVVLTAGAALTSAPATTLPECFEPVFDASKSSFVTTSDGHFDAEDVLRLAWTKSPDSNLTGGGFKIEVSTTSQIEFPSESFVDVIATPTVSSSTFVTDIGDDEASLEERSHWYHVKALGKAGKCTESSWSDILKVTQDATGPAIEMTTSDLSIFTLEPVVIEGTTVDEAGGEADLGAGAVSARVEIANTTPGLGPIFGRPPPQTVEVDPEDGSYVATFPAMQPGTYSVQATGIDAVGNRSGSPAAIEIIVVVNLPS